uniref:36.4 kDa proline-rich protein-like n=1 Tax=Rhizophora mucronata TaxID=61149 RepID=A0A2P2P1Q7_RHIMU
MKQAEGVNLALCLWVASLSLVHCFSMVFLDGQDEVCLLLWVESLERLPEMGIICSHQILEL